jgi:hypothetical protein
MTAFTGKDEVNTFVLIALKNAIKLYVNTGMKANRAYTPANMLAKASEFTGKTYKRGQLQIAYDDLQAIYEDILKKRKEAAQ